MVWCFRADGFFLSLHDCPSLFNFAPGNSGAFFLCYMLLSSYGSPEDFYMMRKGAGKGGKGSPATGMVAPNKRVPPVSAPMGRGYKKGGMVKPKGMK